MEEKPGWVASFDRPKGSEIKYIFSFSWRSAYALTVMFSRAPAGWDNAFTYHGRSLLCMTLAQKEGFNVYVSLDTELLHHEMSDATARLEGDNDRRAAPERRRRSKGPGRLTDEQLADLAPISVAGALRERTEMGTVTVRTNRTDLSAQDARGHRFKSATCATSATRTACRCSGRCGRAGHQTAGRPSPSRGR